VVSIINEAYWDESWDNTAQSGPITFDNVWKMLDKLNEDGLITKHGLYCGPKEEPMGIEERIKRLEDRAYEQPGVPKIIDLGCYGGGTTKIEVISLLFRILDHLDVEPVNTPRGLELQPRPKKEEKD
jgi:hypothetical protein